jgi:hypothetical protein
MIEEEKEENELDRMKEERVNEKRKRVASVRFGGF